MIDLKLTEYLILEDGRYRSGNGPNVFEFKDNGTVCLKNGQKIRVVAVGKLRESDQRPRVYYFVESLKKRGKNKERIVVSGFLEKLAD